MIDYRSWDEAFFSKVKLASSGCWIWTRCKDKDGYGFFTRKKLKQFAHRAVYKKIIGPIKKGMVIDHVCRTRACVNPFHLLQVSQRDNVIFNSKSLQAKNAAKTHCIRGHEFTEENTYKQRGFNRQCKICSRILRIRWRKNNR